MTLRRRHGYARHILIVDDHPLFVEALKLVIQGAFPQASVSEATSIDAARAILDKDDPFDLVLLDLSMPGTRGLDGLHRVAHAPSQAADRRRLRAGGSRASSTR